MARHVFIAPPVKPNPVTVTIKRRVRHTSECITIERPPCTGFTSIGLDVARDFVASGFTVLLTHDLLTPYNDDDADAYSAAWGELAGMTLAEKMHRMESFGRFCTIWANDAHLRQYYMGGTPR